jgi:hypothetical protein
LVYGFPCCIDSGTCIPLKAGNMSGPTAQGIATRFAADTDPREGICFSNYMGNGERLIVAPITGPLEGSGSGSCYRVICYARFFLTRIPAGGSSNLIDVNFLGYVSVVPVSVEPSTWGSIKTRYR